MHFREQKKNPIMKEALMKSVIFVIGVVLAEVVFEDKLIFEKK